MDMNIKGYRNLSLNHHGKVNGFIPDGELDLNVECERLGIKLYYTKTEKGFQVFQKKPENYDDKTFGTLYIQIEFEGMFGGPLVTFHTSSRNPHELDLIQSIRRNSSVVSMGIHLPHGGVSARDGVGDWRKAFSLSRDRLDCTDQ